MNPDAKVKILGVPVGRVGSIEDRPDGQAAIHLAMDPDAAGADPRQRRRDIASSTVFGAKSVDFVPPAESVAAVHCSPARYSNSEHVTVEINTVFQQLTSVLSKIEPEKLNETLGALASALQRPRASSSARRSADLDKFLAQLDPSLPNLSHDIAVAPQVLNAYADAAPDLMRRSRQLDADQPDASSTEQHEPRRRSWSASSGWPTSATTSSAATGRALTDLLHLLAPTTDLTNEYNPALNCALAGAARWLQDAPPPDNPGAVVTIGFTLGCERYRYPANLPKVAAKGGPQCLGLPDCRFEHAPAVPRRRHRHQPGAVRQPGNPAELRRAQAVAVRPDRRAAAQHRADRTTRMTRSRGHFVKFGVFARGDGGADRGSCSSIFGQYRTGSTNGYSAVFADASRLKAGRLGAGRRAARRHRRRRRAAAGQHRRGDVRRRPRRRADHRHPGRRALPEPGR